MALLHWRFPTENPMDSQGSRYPCVSDVGDPDDGASAVAAAIEGLMRQRTIPGSDVLRCAIGDVLRCRGSMLESLPSDVDMARCIMYGARDFGRQLARIWKAAGGPEPFDTDPATMKIAGLDPVRAARVHGLLLHLWWAFTNTPTITAKELLRVDQALQPFEVRNVDRMQPRIFGADEPNSVNNNRYQPEACIFRTGYPQRAGQSYVSGAVESGPWASRPCRELSAFAVREPLSPPTKLHHDHGPVPCTSQYSDYLGNDAVQTCVPQACQRRWLDTGGHQPFVGNRPTEAFARGNAPTASGSGIKGTCRDVSPHSMTGISPFPSGPGIKGTCRSPFSSSQETCTPSPTCTRSTSPWPSMNGSSPSLSALAGTPVRSPSPMPTTGLQENNDQGISRDVRRWSRNAASGPGPLPFGEVILQDKPPQLRSFRPLASRILSEEQDRHETGNSSPRQRPFGQAVPEVPPLAVSSTVRRWSNLGFGPPDVAVKAEEAPSTNAPGSTSSSDGPPLESRNQTSGSSRDQASGLRPVSKEDEPRKQIEVRVSTPPKLPLGSRSSAASQSLRSSTAKIQEDVRGDGPPLESRNQTSGSSRDQASGLRPVSKEDEPRKQIEFSVSTPPKLPLGSRSSAASQSLRSSIAKIQEEVRGSVADRLPIPAPSESQEAPTELVPAASTGWFWQSDEVSEPTQESAVTIEEEARSTGSSRRSSMSRKLASGFSAQKKRPQRRKR